MPALTKKCVDTPSQWKKAWCEKALGVMVCTYPPSIGRKPKNRRIQVQPCLGKKQDPVSRITRAKWTIGCSSSSSMPALQKHESLSSNPSPT
jgi:hypothetical protein